MSSSLCLRRSSAFFVALTLIWFVAIISSAQQGDRRRGAGGDTLPDSPQVLSFGAQRFRVSPIKGFFRPSALSFLPNGDMIVAERSGALRIVRNGVLDPQPIANITVHKGSGGRWGLWDVAVHPRFAQNQLVYFSYIKPNPSDPSQANRQGTGTSVLARGRFDGRVLTDIQEIFVSNTWTSAFSVAKIVFAPDGKIFLGIGMATGPDIDRAQDPESHAGKILRLNDDGTVPSDNPFVGKAGYQPEVYAMGFRDPLGLMIHPQTGELWEADHGPQGGDEVNIVQAGKNYGWPVVSYGRAYGGQLTGNGGPQLAEPCAPGMEQPFLVWIPVIAPGNMIIYAGDKFPAWKGNLLIGGMGSEQLHMVVFNERGLPVRRVSMMTELKQRIRDVKQGPDGLVYLTTDHEKGAVLKVEPVVNDSAK